MNVSITEAVHSKVVAFLVPLFLLPIADEGAAKITVIAMLAGYKPRNAVELRLAALVIAFSFGALDALSRSMDPDLTINQVLRLRGNANALNRASLQNQNALQAMQAEPPTQAETPTQTEPRTQADPQDDLPLSLEPADLVSFARTAPAPLSRQQRRAAERQAEKARRRTEVAARLAERKAKLTKVA